MKEYNEENLGFTEDLSKYRSEKKLNQFNIGRVSCEHRNSYTVLTKDGDIDCELIGNLRFTAKQKLDMPIVGDWVALNEYDAHKGLIYTIYPRKNIIERQAVGRNNEKQIITSNVDYGLIVQAVNRDYSINRLERYITICHSAGIEPVVILSKVDLIEDNRRNKIIDEVHTRIKDIPIFTLSNETGEGFEQIEQMIKFGKTYCLLGSSGVGKSTLINRLAGDSLMNTGAISKTIDRGKHVTTHRALIALESGGVLIDNPGIREVGVTDSSQGIEETFEQIYELAKDCKFNDCSHQNEKACAVIAALDTGELNEATYSNFMKLKREQVYFQTTLHEKRKKDKTFGKMAKQIMNQKYKRRN